MTHTLISFLGKSQKKDGLYSSANYDFDGQVETTRFFALALNKVIKPDRQVILGTSGSMWDVLFENFADVAEYEEQTLQLIDAVANDSVSQSQLDACEPLLKQRLGLNCQLRLIPYGENTKTQVEILQIMAEGVNKGDQVSLDLTHGLRHLPMLGLLSAMYLQTAKKVKMGGIYYGALDRTPRHVDNPLTPVMRLDGLLKIADWITALHGFDKTGDIAPFSELLQQEDVMPETAELLKTAAFHESILNITDARRPLRDFAKQTAQGLPGIASLFQDSLNERISWKDQDSIYLRQREQACFYLQRGDYVRAATWGYEALITYHLKQQNPRADEQSYELRKQVREKLEAEKGDHFQQYKLLRNIRNSLAHANRADTKEVQQALSSQERLQQTLTGLFTKLLPDTTQ